MTPSGPRPGLVGAIVGGALVLAAPAALAHDPAASGGLAARLLDVGDEAAGSLEPGSAGGLCFRPADGTGSVPLDSAAGLRLSFGGREALGGVGIALHRGPADDWRVADVSAGGPAAESAALRPGDVLAAIAEGAAGRPVVTAGLEREEVEALLRGPSGSSVRLTVSDPPAGDGVAPPLREMTLERTEAGRGDLAGADARDALEKARSLKAALARRQGGAAATLLHLGNGDVLEVEVLRGDAAALQVRLGDGSEVTVAASAVRALELSPAVTRSISRRKLQRLLMVPRAQAADPPRHVIRTVSGDYVRGRLVAIDAESVRLAVLGVEQRFERRNVARIIRLGQPGEPRPSARQGVQELGGVAVQVVGPGVRRLTLAATGLEGGVLVGTSEPLGAIRVDLRDAEELLVGPAIDDAAPPEAPFAKWVLALPAP